MDVRVCLLGNFSVPSQSHLHLVVPPVPHLESPQHKSSPVFLPSGWVVISWLSCTLFWMVYRFWLGLPLTSSSPLCPGEHCSLLSLDLLGFFCCCCFPDPHLLWLICLLLSFHLREKHPWSLLKKWVCLILSVCYEPVCRSLSLLRTITIKVITNFTSAVFVPVTTHYIRHHFTKVHQLNSAKLQATKESCPMENLFWYLISEVTSKQLSWKVKLNQSRSSQKEGYSS